MMPGCEQVLGNEDDSMSSRPMTWWVDKQVQEGHWREAHLPPNITGLDREISIFEANRKSSFIKHDPLRKEERAQTWCPPIWYDLAIGSGPCGLLCRSCFLMLTHRIRRDPRRHLIYVNFDDMRREVLHWLKTCGPKASLGLGIDCSDSLLYDRYTGITQWIVPMFGDRSLNTRGVELVLLTKSANVDQLEKLPHHGKTVVSFSLNPQEIADLWEGIAPPMERRLEAGLKVQEWGYDYRWRLDPILSPVGWEEIYESFLRQASMQRHRPSRITLGLYRQKNTQLLDWAARWGMPPMAWEPPELLRQGSHYHLPPQRRAEIYRVVMALLWKYFPQSQIGLCKETHVIRKELRVCSATCNCLNGLVRVSDQRGVRH